MKMLYCFIGCLLIKISLQINNLMFNLEPNEQHCLEEYFSDRTLIIYEIFSSTKIFDVRILDPEGKSISEKLDETSFKHAFTSFIGGYYQSCILNKSKEVAEINFTIRHGVAAKDYSSVAKTKDLKPLELDLQKLDDKTKEMSHFITFAAAHETLFEDILNSLTSKITFFSSIIIGVMISVGLIETFYLKRYMEKRKII